MSETDTMLAAEAVYGFCAWLTTRKEQTIMSSHEDAAPIADLIKTFCAVNQLPEPRQDWTDKLTHPK